MFLTCWLSAKNILEGYGSIGTFAREKYIKGQFLELADEMVKAFQGVRYLYPFITEKLTMQEAFYVLPVDGET